MATKTRPKKPPLRPRRVSSDDLAVEVGGETYYPHAGEWVEFKGRPPVGLFLKFSQLGNHPEAVELLATSLHGWNWTDDEGAAYAPPTLEELHRLPAEELVWLLRHAASEPASAEELGNGSTPST